MKKLFKKISYWWSNFLYGRRLRKEIMKAEKIKAKTGMKCLVVNVNGRPTAVTKRELKGFKKAGYLLKYLDLEKVEKGALYNTM